MSANVNTTMNGIQPSSCFNPTAERIGKTIAYCLLFVVSLTGNSLIGLIVYKTKTMGKPINFFIVNMAMSDLLYPIFLVPRKITKIHVGSWLISGPLGQAIVIIRKWLWNPANYKETNKYHKIYVGRSTTLHNLLFWAHALGLNYVTATFLLASSSGTNHDLLCFVQGQRQKSEQKHRTKNFAKLHNHLLLLTMARPCVSWFPS